MALADSTTKSFNTALIATKIPTLLNYSEKLELLLQSPPFQAILQAIRNYSIEAGVSEEQASEEIVKSFRDIDQIWDEYIFQEGLDKLRTHLSN